MRAIRIAVLTLGILGAAAVPVAAASAPHHAVHAVHAASGPDIRYHS